MPNSNFLDAQLTYESLDSFDLDSSIASLNTALLNYTTTSWTLLGIEGGVVSIPANSYIKYGTGSSWVYKTTTGAATNITIGNTYFGSDPSPGNSKSAFLSGTAGTAAAVETAFAPIAEYYEKLVNINTTLQNYINSTANSISESDPHLLSEERYMNRIHPEESVLARESTYGILPELRVTTLPYLLSASVFMACLSIFLIFQMLGFSGQINLPPSVTMLLSSPASNVPYYQNPMVLGGSAIVLVISTVIFGILYFQAKNTNRR